MPKATSMAMVQRTLGVLQRLVEEDLPHRVMDHSQQHAQSTFIREVTAASIVH